MDEAWELAVQIASAGKPPSSLRSLTLDSSLTSSLGRLPSPSLFQKFSHLRVLSVSNVGLSSLSHFPSLPSLHRLILSDNRISGGLESLVQARLTSLRDLDLSNNRIQFLNDLAPLAQLNLLSLDLYECPVTRLPDYGHMVFSLIKSLQYLDKVDAENNEKSESDDEEEEDDVEDNFAKAEGNDQGLGKPVGGTVSSDGAEDEYGACKDDDEEEDGEESDEVEEEDNDNTRYSETANNLPQSNEDSEEDKVDDDNDGEDVELQEFEESEEEGAGEEEEDAGEGENQDVEDEEEGIEHASDILGDAEGEIDLQDDENGELGLEEEDVYEVDNDDEEDEVEEEDYGTEYLVQPLVQAEDEGASDLEPGEEEEDDSDDIDEENQDVDPPAPAASSKRKKSEDEDDDSEEDERPPKR